MATTRISGHTVVTGSLQQALAMIGTRTEPWVSDVIVDVTAIRHYCATVEDGNPVYRDEDFAREVCGGIAAPPGMLQSWIIPLAWSPRGERSIPSLSLIVPLPGPYLINLSTDCEYFEPLRVGDRLSFTEELIAVSDEKRTRIGIGHLVTTRSEFRNQGQALVARVTNVLLRYQKPEETPA